MSRTDVDDIVEKDESENLSEIYKDPWSSSCYVYYKDLCLDLSIILKIREENWNIYDLECRFYVLLQEYFSFDDQEQVIRIEFVLSGICKCLRAELNRSKQEVENKEHNDFFIAVCKTLCRIYNRYEYQLEYANQENARRGKQLIPNIVKTRFRDVFKKCFKKYRATKKSSVYDRVGVRFY